MRIKIFSVSLILQEGAYTNLEEKLLTALNQHCKMESKSLKFNGEVNLCSSLGSTERTAEFVIGRCIPETEG